MLLSHQDVVVFDPAKKEHRQAIRDFKRRYAWTDTPYRFKSDPRYGSIADQVKDKLLTWYMEQEEIRSKKVIAR